MRFYIDLDGLALRGKRRLYYNLRLLLGLNNYGDPLTLNFIFVRIEGSAVGVAERTERHNFDIPVVSWREVRRKVGLFAYREGFRHA